MNAAELAAARRARSDAVAMVTAVLHGDEPTALAILTETPSPAATALAAAHLAAEVTRARPGTVRQRRDWWRHFATSIVVRQEERS